MLGRWAAKAEGDDPTGLDRCRLMERICGANTKSFPPLPPRWSFTLCPSANAYVIHISVSATVLYRLILRRARDRRTVQNVLGCAHDFSRVLNTISPLLCPPSRFACVSSTGKLSSALVDHFEDALLATLDSYSGADTETIAAGTALWGAAGPSHFQLWAKVCHAVIFQVGRTLLPKVSETESYSYLVFVNVS